MVDATETNLSGAPDNVEEKPPVIWNERNELVHPEMDAHYKEQAHIALYGHPQPDGSAENPSGEIVPPNTPVITQKLSSQTEDVMTNPLPSTDPNSMPARLSPLPAEQDELNRSLIDAAKAGENEPRIDVTKEIENTGGNPIREDELGNVRGNPDGAEGGANPPPLENSTAPEEPRTIPPRGNKRSG